VTALKLRKIGNSVGLTLPSEILGELRLSEGDVVHLTKAPGGLYLSPYDPAFEQQMSAARKVMKKRRNVLRELAK
jgi:putative addiction module antidote